LKRTTLQRRALWLAAAALWAEEIAEAITPLRGLDSRLDSLLDNLTGALTVIAALWQLHEYYAGIHADIRRRDQQVADLTDFANVAVQRLETGEPRATMPLRAVNGKDRRS
jgi:hypothetical protein